MQEKLISGKVVSAKIKGDILGEVKELKLKGIQPKLSVIIVGDDPASKRYVKGKHNDCIECEILSEIIELEETVSEEELLSNIQKLNDDDSVDGVLVQLPLPKHIDEYKVINAINPAKDVDGFCAINVGNLYLGKDCFMPCTPKGCIDLLDFYNIDIKGKNAVVIGRSNIVGKPVAALLTKRDATVTITHSKTKDIKNITKNADIIIVAIGKRAFLTADMVKEGAVVIDVGINVNENGKLCGDADFDNLINKVSMITPVPGGVGLMTRVNLLKNTVKSAKMRENK